MDRKDPVMTSPHTEIDFEIRPSSRLVPAAEREQMMVDPGFGRVFTDHMIIVEWGAETGWHDARLQPYGPLSLDPSTVVFHYAQEFFEGLKAYRQADGSVATPADSISPWRWNRAMSPKHSPRCGTRSIVCSPRGKAFKG